AREFLKEMPCRYRFSAIVPNTLYGIGLKDSLSEKVKAKCNEAWVNEIRLPNDRPDQFSATIAAQIKRLRDANVNVILIGGTWHRVKQIFDALEQIDVSWMESKIFVISS